MYKFVFIIIFYELLYFLSTKVAANEYKVFMCPVGLCEWKMINVHPSRDPTRLFYWRGEVRRSFGPSGILAKKGFLGSQKNTGILGVLFLHQLKSTIT